MNLHYQYFSIEALLITIGEMNHLKTNITKSTGPLYVIIGILAAYTFSQKPSSLWAGAFMGALCAEFGLAISAYMLLATAGLFWANGDDSGVVPVFASLGIAGALLKVFDSRHDNSDDHP
jgi:hypothetical protein